MNKQTNKTMNISFYIKLCSIIIPIIIGRIIDANFAGTLFFSAYIFFLTMLATQKEEKFKPQSKISKYLGCNKYSKFLSM